MNRKRTVFARPRVRDCSKQAAQSLCCHQRSQTCRQNRIGHEGCRTQYGFRIRISVCICDDRVRLDAALDAKSSRKIQPGISADVFPTRRRHSFSVLTCEEDADRRFHRRMSGHHACQSDILVGIAAGVGSEQRFLSDAIGAKRFGGFGHALNLSGLQQASLRSGRCFSRASAVRTSSPADDPQGCKAELLTRRTAASLCDDGRCCAMSVRWSIRMLLLWIV